MKTALPLPRRTISLSFLPSRVCRVTNRCVIVPQVSSRQAPRRILELYYNLAPISFAMRPACRFGRPGNDAKTRTRIMRGLVGVIPFVDVQQAFNDDRTETQLWGKTSQPMGADKIADSTFLHTRMSFFCGSNGGCNRRLVLLDFYNRPPCTAGLRRDSDGGKGKGH